MTRETFIVMVSLVLTIIFVVVIAIGLVDAAEALTNKAACSMMMFGDNWTLGYHNETVQKCLFLL